MFDHGIATIVDLRAASELRMSPPVFGDHPGYRHMSMLEENPDRSSLEGTVGDSYVWLLDAMRARIGVILGAIADAPPGGVLVHCFAGKDRTGLVSALVLSVAGVGREAIAEDYALSRPGLVPMLEEWLAAEPDPKARDYIRRRFECDPDTMRAVLEHVDERHGSVAGYLTNIGVDAAAQSRLRARLLAD